MRRFTLALVSAVAIMAGACSDDPQAPAADPIEGTYTLRTINGQQLPFLLIDFQGIFRMYQSAGTMRLDGNGTFRETAVVLDTTFEVTGPVRRDTTIVLTGRWEAQDSVVLLTTDSDGSVLFGTAARGRLVLHYETAASDTIVTYVYTR